MADGYERSSTRRSLPRVCISPSFENYSHCVIFWTIAISFPLLMLGPLWVRLRRYIASRSAVHDPLAEDSAPPSSCALWRLYTDGASTCSALCHRLAHDI